MITADSLSPQRRLVPLPLSLIFICCSYFVESTDLTSATAYGGGTTWINNHHSLNFLQPSDYKDSLVRPILLTADILYSDLNLVQFGCGFFCYGSPCNTGYLFATFFLVKTKTGEVLDMQMVWSSNRNQMVQENAALTLTSMGELMLRDSDGTLVWSTNTSTHDFQRMAIQESGNLVLLNKSNGIMWQPFDHPTDTLLAGQKFKVGQKLIASISPTNTREGILYSTLSTDGFGAFTDTVPPLRYYMYPYQPSPVNLSYNVFDNVSVYFYSDKGLAFAPIPITSKSLSCKIDSDGHFQYYSYQEQIARSKTDYLSTSVTKQMSVCDYPTPCGKNGLCTDGQCSCPTEGDIFHQVDPTTPSSGCLPHTPVVCSDSNPAHGNHLLELEHVSYFTYRFNNPSVPQLVSRDYCQSLCLANCSCKAVFFRYDANFSEGYCYLESNVFSLKMNNQSDKFYNSTAYIRIQSAPKEIRHSVMFIIVSTVGGVVFLFLSLCTWKLKYHKVSPQMDHNEDDPEDWPPGLPVRYSYQELKIATNDFTKKLGSGGFGSVYEGVLSDGTMIAVKRLDGAGQGEKEFRREVQTLGKTDHLNLVRLKGFSAEKVNRMLVYEHLPNGFLDKWIFSTNSLDWKTRYRIVLNIARGMTYLHEECREQIIHFDIKPQNILLDQNYCAKVSDFGLAKLINREQNEVVTLIRGTPGYMAPELLNMHFTEKADVFSFGVVVIEIVSGKRRRDLSDDCLFSMLQVKAEERKLIDLVYEGFEEDETSVREEAVKLIKVGMWCVQEDFTRRPAMSRVVKALEGLIDTLDDVPSAIAPVACNQQFLCLVNPNLNRELSLSKALTSSLLSGPR